MKPMAHYVAYLSPTGRTRQVAVAVEGALRGRGSEVQTLDLGREGRGFDPAEWLPATGGPVCVWVGSPVYAQHPLPQVLRFIEGLPVIPRGHAVPFVTWGTVSSGLSTPATTTSRASSSSSRPSRASVSIFTWRTRISSCCPCPPPRGASRWRNR